LKNELHVKDDELTRRQEMINEARLENDKLMDENLQMKKDNFNLKSRVEVLEIEFKNKSDNENKLKNQELKTLREKEKNMKN